MSSNLELYDFIRADTTKRQYCLEKLQKSNVYFITYNIGPMNNLTFS